ncbi:MAG: histidinol-phosphatase [archaeon]|jgi:histidinol-phosphatase (PHP family)
MQKINMHVHSTGSDGKLPPEQVIQEAIKDKIDFLCITDHYPCPNNLDPYSKDNYKEGHFENLKALSEKYKSKINVCVGAEFDWVEGYKEWYKKEISKKPCDLVIGSIHAIFTKNGISGFWDKESDRKKFIEEFGGTKKYVLEYFKQMRLLIKSELFDCVGHFDVIKLNNRNNSLFSENEKWYIKEVKDCLDLLAKSKIVLEINARGLVKGHEQYPSLWILKEAKKRNIPLTIGTDFHNYGENEPYLEKIYHLAREAGYKEAVRFEKRKKIVVSIV